MRSPTLGRDDTLLVRSSVHVIQAFIFFRHHHPPTLACGILVQQAFEAAKTLVLNAWESYNEKNEELIGEACAIFNELQSTGLHKFAEMAFSDISAYLVRLRHRRQECEKGEPLFGLPASD